MKSGVLIRNKLKEQIFWVTRMNRNNNKGKIPNRFEFKLKSRGKQLTKIMSQVQKNHP